MSGWIWPVPSGYVSQGFQSSWLTAEGPAYATFPFRKAHDPGNGPFPGGLYYAHFHAAIDLAADYWSPIFAPQAGVVMDAKWGGPGSWANGGGYFVRVRVNENCQYLLAHMAAPPEVVAGQSVHQGQLLGRVGATGVATGNHTHFWVRLGPPPYYDPDAFYYDPRLVLAGGDLYEDNRFSPGYAGPSIPDTGTTTPQRIVAMGDPSPRKFKSLIEKHSTKTHHLRAFKPIRAGATTDAHVITHAGSSGRTIDCVGRIEKEKLPDDEQKFGDVFVCVVFDDGWRFGYVKAVDIRF